MNKLLELNNIFQKELKELYSKNEITNILRLLVEFELKMKMFKVYLAPQILRESSFKKILFKGELYPK